MRRRIDDAGTREASMPRQGTDRIVIQVTGFDDPQRLKALLGEPAVMSFRFVNENIAPGARIPPSYEILPAAESERRAGFPASYVVSKRVIVDGDHLTNAQATFDQDGRPAVSFNFDTLGAKRFGDATRDNVGRIFAIILDDEVISAPRIQSAITGGSGIITGSFSVETAQDRSEEHTSELQSLMRISYAFFCLKKKTN